MKKKFELIKTKLTAIEKILTLLESRNNKDDIIILADIISLISNLKRDFELSLYKLAVFKNICFNTDVYLKTDIDEQFLDERIAVIKVIEDVESRYSNYTCLNLSKNVIKSLDKDNLNVSFKLLMKTKKRFKDIDVKIKNLVDKYNKK